jgi:hypothetical protein
VRCAAPALDIMCRSHSYWLLGGPINISRNTAKTSTGISSPLIQAARRYGRFLHESYRRPNPCSGEAVRLALKKMGRETSVRQAQARALGWDEIKQFIETAGKGAPGGSRARYALRGI